MGGDGVWALLELLHPDSWTSGIVMVQGRQLWANMVYLASGPHWSRDPFR